MLKCFGKHCEFIYMLINLEQSLLMCTNPLDHRSPVFFFFNTGIHLKEREREIKPHI